MFDHLTEISAVQSKLTFVQEDFPSHYWCDAPPVPLEKLPHGLIEDQI